MKKNDEAVELAGRINKFLTDYVPKHLSSSKNTLKNYNLALGLYLDFLEDELGIDERSFKIDHFDVEIINKWLEWLQEKRNCTGQTCNVRLGSLRSFLKYLYISDKKYMYIYTRSKLAERKATAQIPVTGLTRDSIKALFGTQNLSSKIGRRNFLFMIMMYGTAARLDELLSLKLENLHLDISSPYVTYTGKGDRIRSLFLLPEIVVHLKKYIREEFGENPDQNSYLFHSRSKGYHHKMSEQAIEKMMRQASIKARIIDPSIPENFHPHQLRHSKATHWIEDGMNIMQVSALLGHAQLETTMVYINESDIAKKEALQTLEDELDQNVKPLWKNSDGSLRSLCKLR